MSMIRYFDPKQIRFFRSRNGIPRMEVEGECCYLRVIIRRAFPLSDISHYISICDSEDKEIGMIRDVQELDETARQIIEKEVSKRYFTPVIQSIRNVRERFGVYDWEVETDRGPAKFMVRGLHTNVDRLPPRRLLVKDTHNNRYEIPDIAELDARSLGFINRML